MQNKPRHDYTTYIKVKIEFIERRHPVLKYPSYVSDLLPYLICPQRYLSKMLNPVINKYIYTTFPEIREHDMNEELLPWKFKIKFTFMLFYLLYCVACIIHDVEL